MSTESLVNTFATFFSDDKPPARKCLDCGSERDLEVLFTAENGDQTWVCKDCKAKRNARQRQVTAEARARVQEWAAMDAYEE